MPKLRKGLINLLFRKEFQEKRNWKARRSLQRRSFMEYIILCILLRPNDSFDFYLGNLFNI